MARTLAIHVDAQRLIPHQDPADNNTFLTLGITIQTVFEPRADANPPVFGPSDLNLLNPWGWVGVVNNPITFDVFILPPSAPGSVLPNLAKLTLDTTGSSFANSTTALLAREMKLLNGDPASFQWDPFNPGAAPPAQGHVLHLMGTAGRLASPLGDLLNLTAVVAIPLQTIQHTFPGLLDQNNKFPAGVQILVAPRFKSENGAATFIPASSGPDAPSTTGLAGMFRWSYDVSPAGDSVNAYGVPVDPLELPDPGPKPTEFIRLTDYWINPSLGDTQLPDSGVDWHAQLAERIAFAWDTPRLLLDATKNCVSIPSPILDPSKPTPFRVYWQLVLAALRDRAGLGLIETTDGMSLLEYAIRHTPSLSDPNDNDRIIRDDQLRSLVAKLRVAEVAAATGSGGNLTDWLNVLVGGDNPLLPDLKGKLPPVFDPPARQATLVWPAGSPGIPVANAAKLICLARYDRLDLPPVADPSQVADAIKLTPWDHTKPTQVTDTYTLRVAPNGDLILSFSPSQCSVILMSGFYEAVPFTVPSGSNPAAPAPASQRSTRVSIAPAVADDVAPLSRALAELNRDDILAKLLNSCWGTLAKNNPLASLPRGAQSGPWFATVRTGPVSNATNNPVTADFVGDITAGDGRFWVTTIAGVTPTNGAQYALEYRNQSLASQKPDLGQPDDMALVVTVTCATVAGSSPKTRLTIAVSYNAFVSPPPPAVPGQTTKPLANDTVTVDGVDPYHLRVEIWRDLAPPTAAGKPPLGVLRLAIVVGTGTEGSLTWLFPQTISVDAASAPPVAGLERLALLVCNDLRAASNPLVCGWPPTLLAARQSLVAPGTNSLRDKWDTRFDQGLKLWNDAADPKTGVPFLLPKLQLQHRLAFAQTARLWPVWNDQSADGNFVKQLTDRFTTQFTNLFDQRFTANQAGGVYRDFLPPPTITAAPDTDVPVLWQFLKTYLSNRAAQVLDTQPLIDNADAGLGGAVEQNADLYPTKIPHALNLQVDTEHTLDDEQKLVVGDDDDLLRKISGYGVLIRQAKPASATEFTTWNLLNYVDIVAIQSTATPLPVVCQDVVAPIPLHHQNAVRQTTLSFNNRMFLARSPLNDLGDTYFGVDGVDTSLQVFRYEVRTPPLPPPAPPVYDWGKFPSLKFGQVYEALPFVMGNCGALPKKLNDSSHPCQLLANPPTDTDLGSTILGLRRGLKYLRRVRVGTPRRADIPGTRGLLPKVPTNVLPLAQEWGLSSLTFGRPFVRFLYDENQRTGQLDQPVNWAFQIPRVTVAGRPAEPDGKSTNPTQFSIFAGVAWSNDDTTTTKFGVTITRAADKLSIQAPNTPILSLSLTLPDGTTPLQNGALDLRVLRTDGNFFVSCRRADLGEPWQDFPVLPVPTPVPQPGHAWLVLWRVDAIAPNEAAVTFGAPGFAERTVPSSGNASAPTDDALGFRPLDVPLRVLSVLTPPDLKASPITSTFNLRPASVDLETWDRWLAMDAYLDAGSTPPPRPKTVPATGDLLAFRKNVWADYYTNAMTPRPTPLPGQPPVPTFDDRTATEDAVKATIDDPAVELLVIELVPLLVESPQLVQRLAAPIPRDTTQAGLGFLRSTGIAFNVVTSVSLTPVTARITTSTTPTTLPFPPSPTSTTVTINIAEQEIWELRVYPAVKKSLYSPAGAQRFHSRFNEGATYTYVETTTDPYSDGLDYVLCEPWTAVLEVATQAVLLAPPPAPSNPEEMKKVLQQSLLTAIQPAFVNARNVVVALNKQDPRSYRYMANLRLLRQVWRWQGRPVPPFPYGNVKPDRTVDPTTIPPNEDVPLSELDSPATVIAWDAAGFGDRSAIDMLDETTQVAAASPTATLFTEDLGNDLRSLYYRFTAQAMSRYAGLYPANPPVLSSVFQSPAPPDCNAWQRLVVPCRRVEQVPRPVVRFVVPLTESEDNKTPSTIPGLLVVLDETWFVFGGVAEDLQAEIVQCNDYYGVTRTTAPKVRPEFGPDPTLRGAGWTQGNGDPRPDALAMEVVGPIGHTFDTNAEAPLFNASSFILRPPGVNLLTDEDSLAWYFAKIRFRRALLAEAMVDYPTGSLPNAGTPTTLSLDASKDWVVDLTDLTASSSAPAGATVKLDSAASLGTFTLTVAGDTSLTLTWDGANGTKAKQTIIAPSMGWASAKIDLRLILQLDASTADPSTKPPPSPPRHLTVMYRLSSVKPTTPGSTVEVADIPPRVWRILQVQSSGAAAWPPADLLFTPNGITVGNLKVTPARVSPFTTPYWVQFLPESQLLQLPVGNPSLASGLYGLAWGTAVKNRSRFTLSRFDDDRQTSTDITQVWGSSQLDTTTINVALKDEHSDVRLQRRVIVTELIADVRGQLGQERYIGLYRFPASDGALVLEETHRSPTFDISEASGSRRYRARVVEFQLVGSNADQDPDDIANNSNPGWWDTLFPPGDSGTDDIQARVVRVSPPIELVTVPVKDAPIV